MRHKVYKYRIYPNKEQRDKLSQFFGCVRKVWNLHVEAFNLYDKNVNKKIVYSSTKELREQYSFMQAVAFSALNEKKRDFENFIQQYFNKNRKKKLGRPNFKKKTDYNSFRLLPADWRILNNKIRLSKLGWIKIVVYKPIPFDAVQKTVTISLNKSGQYFASILVSENIVVKSNTGKRVGLDAGLNTLIQQSDGKKLQNLRLYSNNQAELRKLQKKFSRQQIGSKRREKTRMWIARLFQKMTNQKQWFYHNYTTKLVSDYDEIFIEDLNIAGMMQNHKLAKYISDASWSEIFRQLEYKCDWYGKTLIRRDRFFASSKTCRICGMVHKDLKLKDRMFVCPNCNHTECRDLHAAQNVLSGANTQTLNDVEMRSPDNSRA